MKNPFVIPVKAGIQFEWRFFPWGILFLITFLHIPQLLSAAVSPIPSSARAFGMGNAFTAVANDVNTVFFNPAGLATLKQMELSALAGRTFTGSLSPQTEAHAEGALPLAAYKTEWGDFGTGAFSLHRTGRSGDGDFTNASLSWGISPALLTPKGLPFTLPEKFYTGLAIRARQASHSLTATSDTSSGIDLGFLYQLKDGETPIEKGWSVGAAIQDVNTLSPVYPPLFRLGGAWRNPESTLALDFVYQDGVAKFFPGIEIAFFRKLLLLRAGSGEVPGVSTREISLGLGTLLPPFQMDLAYGIPTGDASGSNDRILFSLTYRFGSPHLSQYVYEERLEKVSEVENKVAQLISKKNALASSIREEKDLYQTIISDTKQAKSRAADASKETKESETRLTTLKKEIADLEEELRKIRSKKETIAQEKKAQAEKAEVRPPFTETRKHIVQPGDSLRGLAQKYYGDPNKWQIIYDANQDKIIRGVPKDGETLTIP